eukprot:5158105-Amphidinium_carterae.1
MESSLETGSAGPPTWAISLVKPRGAGQVVISVLTTLSSWVSSSPRPRVAQRDVLEAELWVTAAVNRWFDSDELVADACFLGDRDGRHRVEVDGNEKMEGSN